MARFFFHLHNDFDTQDTEGRELPDLEEPRRQATEEARMMAAESVQLGHLDLSHFVRVTTADGTTVLKIKFGDAVDVRR